MLTRTQLALEKMKVVREKREISIAEREERNKWVVLVLQPVTLVQDAGCD